MAALVFMRGVNVGGHKPFRPAVFAKTLSAFDVLNIGAAGTFIVRKKVSEATLRAEFIRRLPVKADFMICPARAVMEVMSADPFPREDSVKGTRRFVSVLATHPSSAARLPLSYPAGKAWQVKIVGLYGKFALSSWRRTGKRMVYPNTVVERGEGTTRPSYHPQLGHHVQDSRDPTSKMIAMAGGVQAQRGKKEGVHGREPLARLREAGVVPGGPPPFSRRDRSRFLRGPDELIHAIRRDDR